jgi:hypothetical protein
MIGQPVSCYPPQATGAVGRGNTVRTLLTENSLQHIKPLITYLV